MQGVQKPAGAQKPQNSTRLSTLGAVLNAGEGVRMETGVSGITTQSSDVIARFVLGKQLC